MFRVVIADDEKFIVQLIRALIDEQRLGVRVVGEASDGAHALELVTTLRPDILITDIRMPAMDGLELIEQLRRDQIPVAVIAISGHRRFDYALGAIKYGVEDFIVKPISERDLNDALEKVCARLRGEQSASERIRSLAEQVTLDVSTLRARLLEDLAAGTLPDEGLDAINRRYRTGFEPGDFTGFVIRIDEPSAADTAASSIVAKCRKAALDSLRDACVEIECAPTEGGLIGLINTRGDQTGHLMVAIKRMFERLCVELDMYSGIAVSVGLGPKAADLPAAANSVALARASVRAKCVLGAQRIYCAKTLDMENINAQLQNAHVGRLRTLMEGHAVGQVAPWVEQVFEHSEAYYRTHPIEAMALVDSIVRRFRALCGALGIAVDEGEAAARLAQLESAHSLSQLKGALATYLMWTIEADYRRRLEREAYPVMRAKAFIAERMGEAIRLEDIAAEVALSPSYLSALFKKETGETVSDYLLKLRLERAKHLLRTTNLNLNQVAEQVGYQDAKHFSKMFHKQTGARPLEYRKLYAW